MIDIGTHAEIILREAQYETWRWSGTNPAVVCFESQALVGFLHIFVTVDDLLAKWQEAQQGVLAVHISAMRNSGPKAWNVYSVFLTEDMTPSRFSLERIEENFALTRKIARSGIRTVDDLENALLLLLPIKSQPKISNSDFESRLRSRLKDLNSNSISSLLGPTTPADVARILGENS